jgi:hypothetical protein
LGIIPAGYDNFGTPWLQVIAGGQISYNTIQQSISQGYQYGVNGLYMKANSISQLLEIITLEKNNRRGIFELKEFVPTVDPYQLVSAITSDVVDAEQHEQLTFDGKQVFVMPIQASETVFCVFSLEEQSTSNLLQTPTNFELLEYFDYMADFPDREDVSHTQRDILVQLRVQNNSSALGVPFRGLVSLLGGAPDTYAQSANANGLWQWNFVALEPFNVTAVEIFAKKVTELVYTSVTVYGSFQTAQQIANAINVQTALGLFWVTTGGLGQPILQTTNDKLDFQNLVYTGTL